MLTDKELLPNHYTLEPEPSYIGDGHLSVDNLQKLCKQFKEYVHQQALIKQALRERLSQYE